ncbi:sugar dehydrogenase complex small subunit [Maritimibacter sp. UBA3975]|uniref:sugar dehydrogenase complex small subunit n=1 Tax=Maritimibacter sp. UBA3975 TaxID=1946833 RepID=UPI0025BA35E8|nr:sugar dehydrogenase complex small subunit [Maritimibacter sp. UBA3975]|tara:strand:- start:6934 stop:7347 length:414 start_codon:yes stop_codon:yes gene_type:complete
MIETHLSRRLFLGGASAAALMPGAALAQSDGRKTLAFAATCRELAGFDTIPNALVAGAARAFPDEDRTALAEKTASPDLSKSLLKTLYTGMYSPEDGDPTRFAYAEALMYAAVEDSLNVPSYCGGVPGYWAEKPVSA